MTYFQPFFLSLLVLVCFTCANTDTVSAAVVGLTLGFISDLFQHNNDVFYLYHTNATLWQSGITGINAIPRVAPGLANTTILFYNYVPYEGYTFAPPQGSNSEWLIPLDNAAGGVVVHYDVMAARLQIDQVHSGLQVGDWTSGDLCHILWVESQQRFYGISVGQDVDRGELYLSFYADMVVELRKLHPAPIDNITLSLGSHRQYRLDKQTIAVSQQQQLFFIMAETWRTTGSATFSAGLWVYDVVNMDVSQPVIYRNDSGTAPFIHKLVFSEKRNALYAVVALASSLGGEIVQLLVDQLNWTTGDVTHISDSVPVPKAGLDCLTAALDDDTGDVYVVFRSQVPGVPSYVILVYTVNVETKKVQKLAELSTFDDLLGLALTVNSAGEMHPVRPVKRSGASLVRAVRRPQFALKQYFNQPLVKLD